MSSASATAIPQSPERDIAALEALKSSRGWQIICEHIAQTHRDALTALFAHLDGCDCTPDDAGKAKAIRSEMSVYEQLVNLPDLLSESLANGLDSQGETPETDVESEG